MNKKYLDGIDVIYWINLDRAFDRRKKMEKLFQDPIFEGIKIVRIRALDGHLENARLKFKIEDNYDLINDNKNRTDNEYAILYSHLEAIREFSKTDYKNAIIFEDDLSLEYKKYWKKSIQEIIDNAPKDWEILKLSIAGKLYTKLYTPWKPFNVNMNHDIRFDKYKWKKFKLMGDWSANGYVINHKSSKKLIQELYHNNQYVLDNKYMHVSDALLYQKLKTYIYKYPYFTTMYSNYSYNTKNKPNNKFVMFTKKIINNMYEKSKTRKK